MIYEIGHYDAYHEWPGFPNKRRARMAALLAAFMLSFTRPPAPAVTPADWHRGYPPHTFVKARRRKLKGYERRKA
jgi:hypothetical protein